MDLRSEVSHLEATNDSLRREIENQLYAQMIMPDMRSDILKLIEGCDKIINKYETDLILLSIEKTKNPKTIIIDYGGPNVAKPLHVGHLRSAIIGQAINNILKFKGNKTG